MSRKTARFTQADVARSGGQSFVYFVQIGKLVKIGVTRDLKGRLNSFRTSSADVELHHVIPGDRHLEARLHELLADCRVERELFRREHRVMGFKDVYEHAGLERALQWLEESTPRAIAKLREDVRQERVVAQRQTRKEKDAYFASLVADRQKRLGW